MDKAYIWSCIVQQKLINALILSSKFGVVNMDEQWHCFKSGLLVKNFYSGHTCRGAFSGVVNICE